jgi:5'-nucleotidase
MRIMVTNDDGIHAEGLDVCEKIAREISDDVWVIAPEYDQSKWRSGGLRCAARRPTA